MSETQIYAPYCGMPPAPADLWSRWNLDPFLALVLIAGLFMYMRATARANTGAGIDARQRKWFVQGWLALALGLISPLCSLSVALFSARISQHMWLVLIAAPLLALGGVLQLFSGKRSAQVIQALSRPFAATVLFTIALWGWHLPRAYQATFESDLVYWLMHITLTGSAVLLWQSLRSGEAEAAIGRLFAGFATLLQMGLLGALITLAPRVLYPAHLLTSEAWGLTALEDQQLGGLIMWVPGCIALTIFVLSMFLKLLQQSAAATEKQI